jgi:hypothetical protein
VLGPDQPLYAFANVYHILPNTESLPHMKEIKEVCVSSHILSATSNELQSAGVGSSDQTSLLIDDFTRGWHDWYRLNAEHKPYWQNWTRMITDPKWRGPENAALAITLTMPGDNQISIVVVENEWRSYRGQKKTFVCHRAISADTKPQTITLTVADFKDSDGNALSSWSELDQLGLCAYFEETERGQRPKPAGWNGDLPQFHRVEWQIR